MSVPSGAAGFYVSVRTGARMAQSALALGPFPDRNTAADHVAVVRRYIAARHRGAEWWRLSTTRRTAAPGRPLPVGTLNELLGVRCGPP
ncbi:hypothetical protein [Actinomadura fibrosa]|uniref:Uncharacterized protein n=1 Tax=Actinomadura fibrosa TaxID=111802 RepID=A0ABW2XPG5_9ACTN|nr:hypothetical protein [Actinomadura fibrosa]